MEKLKIAVIGTGKRAGAHLATIPKLTDIYNLAAVCDINEERLKPVAERHSVPGYTDVEEMLATEKPDDVARAAAHYSIYRAVVEDIEPEYGAVSARKDMEILIAIRESARKGSLPIELPLTEITEYERGIHESYRSRYGHNPLEVGRKEALTAY
ncbi:MAG: Gfo/Idh/MocA family oxidoreductase [Candidatus Zixiibacteriota bacterium]